MLNHPEHYKDTNEAESPSTKNNEQYSDSDPKRNKTACSISNDH